MTAIRAFRPIPALARRHPARRFGSSHRIIRSVLRMTAILMVWQERARQRRQLLELDDRMLRDIGVSRYDAEREASKPFWQP